MTLTQRQLLPSSVRPERPVGVIGKWRVMAWSISEVARLSKVTSRTLRHYDRIGLLAPASVGANGYRYYEAEQLRRLQQILLYRELGLGLEAISEVLGGERDEVEALRLHHAWLLAEGERLQRLAGTVARTIATVKGDDVMAAEELFEGFSGKQRQWEADLVDRFGADVQQQIDRARDVTRDWTKRDHENAQEQWSRFDDKAVAVLQGGAAIDDPRVVALLDEHVAMLRSARAFEPTAASYAGLGQLYVDHPDFRARYDARDLRLAEFLRDAMASYAASRF